MGTVWREKFIRTEDIRSKSNTFPFTELNKITFDKIKNANAYITTYVWLTFNFIWIPKVSSRTVKFYQELSILTYG